MLPQFYKGRDGRPHLPWILLRRCVGQDPGFEYADKIVIIGATAAVWARSSRHLSALACRLPKRLHTSHQVF
jgi:hypothetical protein